MTSTSGLSTSKPKRRLRAKAFALALLPLALALTACTGGGGSNDNNKKDDDPPITCSDDQTLTNGVCIDDGGNGSDGNGSDGNGSDGNGSDDDKTSTYPGYADDIRVLEDLKKDGGTPVFKVIAANGWLVNMLGAFAQDRALETLATAYKNTLKLTSGGTIDDEDIRLELDDLRKYIGLINNVRHKITSEYNTAIAKKGPLDDLHPYDLEPIETTAPSHSSARVTSDNALRDNENSLLTAVQTKYDDKSTTDSNKKEWGKPKLTDLDLGVNGGGSLDNVLIGWRNNPAAQLSFYHATLDDKSKAVGVDFVHMEDVSFFLYYHASTDKTLENTPSLNRNDFMASLKKKRSFNSPSWTVSGIVNGMAPDNLENIATGLTAGTDKDDLTYNGVMMAATLGKSLETYMGDAKVVLKFNDGNTAVSGVDFNFSNIGLTNNYMMGMKSDNMIKILDVPYDITGGGSDATNRLLDNNGISKYDGNTIYAKFFGEKIGGKKEDIDFNYGGRDAIGGTFKARLTNDEGKVIDKESDMYYGVFGAVAE